MKELKDHLNIDLEFLDKKESVRVVPKSDSNTTQTSSSPTSIPSDRKYNWKNILIIGGVMLFLGWIIFSDNGSSSNSTSNTNTYTDPASSQASNNDLMIGQYSCSRYHYDQVVALDPDETEQQVENARIALETRSNALERIKNQIDSSYVNDYSDQWEIDQYNELVDEYNSKLPAYKRDSAALDARIDRYNTQIQKHNNYLTANCTKKY
jgi:hypothetical protein